MRVLIADDDESTRIILRRRLLDWGHEPVEVADGAAAWAALNAENAPRLALLDWMMPGFTGVEICRMLAARQGPLVYTLILTAADEKRRLNEAIRAGAYDFQLKPIDSDELRSRVGVGVRFINAEIAHDEMLAERKKAEDDARVALDRERELNELKTRFVTIVSHEFRTPLTSIKASSYVIQKYGAKMSEVDKARHFDIIQKSSNYMTALLDDILTLSRADAGQQLFFPKPLHIGDFCRTLCDHFRVIASAGQKLEFTITPEADAVYDADERLIRHALTNLLSNALKYSPENGMVQFDVRLKESHLLFVVGDHGVGIPPDDQKHLFEPFHRGKNVGQIQGTGLGLTIAKRVIEAHGGSMEFSSALGSGTTFTVRIPARIPCPAEGEPAASQGVAAATNQGPGI